ncbi:MAG: putative peptidoglycan glycosyltransferase FtsW [Armatimonadota bacterium]|nr:putative peptidoglycan glycosyltransferase FtsW [Armatimonadota bacterium]
MDRQYFLGVWALMVTGIVFVFSASFPFAGRPDATGMPGNPYEYLIRHSIYVGGSVVAMLVVSLCRPRTIRRWSGSILFICVLLVGMTLFSPWGVSHGGAPRWLKLPGLPEFQPSELMKIAFIALLAAVLARKDEGRDREPAAYGAVLLVTGVITVLMLMQRDQGMATMFWLIALSLLFFAGMRLTALVPLGLGGLALGLVLAHQEPYRWRRVVAFLDPEHAARDVSYHIVNMLIAQARGGITGMGLGMSPDKWRSLPAPHTDSIFSVIGCELGLIGGLVIMAAVVLLTWRALHIARHASRPYGFYLAAGVAAMLCLQSIAHIAVNTSCMPCTGLTLPFISGGGTSLLSASVAVGMVLSVSRYGRRPEP